MRFIRDLSAVIMGCFFYQFCSRVVTLVRHRMFDSVYLAMLGKIYVRIYASSHNEENNEMLNYWETQQHDNSGLKT